MVVKWERCAEARQKNKHFQSYRSTCITSQSESAPLFASYISAYPAHVWHWMTWEANKEYAWMHFVIHSNNNYNNRALSVIDELHVLTDRVITDSRELIKPAGHCLKLSILYEHHANILNHGLTGETPQTLPLHVNILMIPQIFLVFIYGRSVCCVFAE